MYRVVTIITVTQQPSEAWPKRSATITFNLCNEYKSSSSWRDSTNEAEITLPKNIFIRNENGTVFSLAGRNVNIGGFSPEQPFFLRGDKITIDAGYLYFNSRRREISTIARVFTGFISAVTSKKPFVLKCEDNFWKLKQIAAPNKVFPAGKYTLESMLRELLKGTPFTVNDVTKTSIGDFRTLNETVAQVLDRIKKDYHFYNYFRGDELRCGALVYVEKDAIDAGTSVFKFQRNIISDKLEYKRKDDIQLSAIAYSVNKEPTEDTTYQMKKKTKCKRLEVLVTLVNGKFIRKEKKPNERAEFAPAETGERRTLYFWNVHSIKELGDLAEKELMKFYYTGFAGKFETFGLPFVDHGYNIDILDDILPERNGRYKVRAVEYSGGVGGLRQTIELDYLVTRLNENGKPV